MAVITTDLSHLPLDVRQGIRKHLAREDLAKFTVAKANQLRLANLYRGAVQDGQGPKIGPLDTVMDPYFVSHFSRTCEAREMVHDDPEFWAWLKKRHPEFSVPHKTTKVQVGYR